MNEFICGNCLFTEEIGSSDLILCTALGKLRKINEPGCAKFRGGKHVNENMSHVQRDRED